MIEIGHFPEHHARENEKDKVKEAGHELPNEAQDLHGVALCRAGEIEEGRFEKRDPDQCRNEPDDGKRHHGADRTAEGRIQAEKIIDVSDGLV